MSCSVLDEQQFRQSCQLLLKRSDQLGDGWSWESVLGSEEGYLKKTVLRSVPSDWGPLHVQKGFCFHPQPQTPCDSTGQEKQDPAASTGSDFFRAEEEEDDDDGSYKVTNCSSLMLQYEYHILFSCSYGAPVLYFRAFTMEGRSLALEEMWCTIHPNYRLCLQNCPLNAISQQPFFFFHPCRTEEFMGPVLQAAPDQGRPVHYVLSWLSVVGPVVGLDVPLQYCIPLHSAVSLNSTKPD
ncbi:ubiquitin-like-conjugating enzyme ATG10 isoform X3 [Poeciliopsis prolifica]|uniref:ubiquitin-like-conjugating enzyme ATG10 isoform X3 n=1 Tax=Poeciliopsis prolifica TaxID=188132 RepID=UPI002413B07C|nr:ubiquitin-like-conjugating enzyme ATG10 isoform X3 [Poeciliopsis prolifica]